MFCLSIAYARYPFSSFLWQILSDSPIFHGPNIKRFGEERIYKDGTVFFYRDTSLNKDILNFSDSRNEEFPI